jgi:hypothetical protein
MPLDLGTEHAGTTTSTLQDFLPTPVTFLNESHALSIAFLLLGALVVYALIHNHKHSKDTPVPRWSRYFGMLLAVLLLAAAHWPAIAFRPELAGVLGEFIKSQFGPLYQWNPIWSSIGAIANFSYWALLLVLAVYVWQARTLLGAGVIRLMRFFGAVNERV